MLDIIHPIDPSGYEVIQAPPALRQLVLDFVMALLSVLQTDFGKVYLTPVASYLQAMEATGMLSIGAWLTLGLPVPQHRFCNGQRMSELQ